MTQFVTMLLQAAYDIYTGGNGYPQITTRILFAYMLTLLALFYNFLKADSNRLKKDPVVADASIKKKDKAKKAE